MPAWASSAKRDGTASGMKPATALIQAASLVLRSIGARQSAVTRNCAKARLTQNDVSSACTSQISEETPPAGVRTWLTYRAASASSSRRNRRWLDRGDRSRRLRYPAHLSSEGQPCANLPGVPPEKEHTSAQDLGSPSIGHSQELSRRTRRVLRPPMVVVRSSIASISCRGSVGKLVRCARSAARSALSKGWG